MRYNNLKDWFKDIPTIGAMEKHYGKVNKETLQSYRLMCSTHITADIIRSEDQVTLQLPGVLIKLNADGTYILEDTTGG